MNNAIAYHLANQNRHGVGMGHMQPITSIQHIMESTNQLDALKMKVMGFVESFDTHNTIFGIDASGKPAGTDDHAGAR